MPCSSRHVSGACAHGFSGFVVPHRRAPSQRRHARFRLAPGRNGARGAMCGGAPPVWAAGPALAPATGGSPCQKRRRAVGRQSSQHARRTAPRRITPGDGQDASSAWFCGSPLAVYAHFGLPQTSVPAAAALERLPTPRSVDAASQPVTYDPTTQQLCARSGADLLARFAPAHREMGPGKPTLFGIRTM
jgi:hypothetical protein